MKESIIQIYTAIKIKFELQSELNSYKRRRNKKTLPF